MFETILWATDGSANADRALPYAKELAEGAGKKLVAFHCREVFVGGRSGGYPVLADDEELVEKIRGQIEGAQADGLDATVEIVTGSTASTAHVIADAAAELDADVIVVGTRGQRRSRTARRERHAAAAPHRAVPGALDPGRQARRARRARAREDGGEPSRSDESGKRRRIGPSNPRCRGLAGSTSVACGMAGGAGSCRSCCRSQGPAGQWSAAEPQA